MSRPRTLNSQIREPFEFGNSGVSPTIQKPRPVRPPSKIPAHRATVRLSSVPTRKGCDTADTARTYRVCKTPVPHHSTRTHTIRIHEQLQKFSCNPPVFFDGTRLATVVPKVK